MCFLRTSTAQCQYSQYTLYCLPTIKSFDLEGWAVGVAVTVTSTIVQTSRWDIPEN